MKFLELIDYIKQVSDKVASCFVDMLLYNGVSTSTINLYKLD
jgi:hypothetical protein